MNNDLPTCPNCSGHGTIMTFHGVNLGKCDMCLGTGKATHNQMEWRKQGEAMKEIRISERITLREASQRLGISTIDLSKMERGVIEPRFTMTTIP